jgi:PEP-CTERM motif-containing protein
MNNLPLRAALAVLALSAACGARAQVADNTPGNLVVNGSMALLGSNGQPLPTNTVFFAGANPGALTGWSFLNAGASAEYWNSFGLQASPDGGTYLGVQDLATFAPRNNVQGVTQTVSGLTPGAGYQLSFYSMSNHDGIGLQDWQVTFGSTTQTGLTTTPNASQSGTWVQSTMSFTATAASEALTFAAQYLPGSVPEMLNLDGVVLKQASGVPAVPEPETYALFGAGLLLLRWAARRRVR